MKQKQIIGILILMLVFIFLPTATAFTDDFDDYTVGSGTFIGVNGWATVAPNPNLNEIRNTYSFGGSSNRYVATDSMSSDRWAQHAVSGSQYWEIDMNLTIKSGLFNGYRQQEFQFLHDGTNYNSILLKGCVNTACNDGFSGRKIQVIASGFTYTPYDTFTNAATSGYGQSGWLRFKITKTGTNINVKIYNEAGTLLNEQTGAQTVTPSTGTNVRLTQYESTGQDIVTGQWDNLLANELPPPNITSWSNTQTNNQNLTVYVYPTQGTIFNVTANEAITTYTWKLDNVDQSTNWNNITITSLGQGNHTLNVTASNAYGADYKNWTINSSYLNTPVVGFDPSGHVYNTSGYAIYNAKVVLSNATYTDSCTNQSNCFTNTDGVWNATIYENGEYTYTVTKQGYTTLTGSQAFTIGGTSYDFTLTPSQGKVHGHVYTTVNSTGSVPIKGVIDALKRETTDNSIGVGGTLTLKGSPDGASYVIKLESVDTVAQEALIQILKDGSILFDNELIRKGETYQYKIYEDATSTTYIEVYVNSIFEGREVSTIEVNAGFNTYAKTGISFLTFISYISAGPGSVQWGILFANLAAWVNSFTTDGSNTETVTFNATDTQDVIGSQVFDVTTAGNIFSYYIVMNAESITSNAGKVEIGYTDDNYNAPTGFTDTLYINNKQVYRTATADFKALDANGNKKVRVWFKFNHGYSSFKIYEFYMMALGATTLQPLPDASIYQSVQYKTTSDKSDGSYTLNMPLGTKTLYYSKPGYESKNYSFTLSTTASDFTQDVILNQTNITINVTREYVRAEPNPATTDTQIYAYFKTLDKVLLGSSLTGIGGYQIRVCQLLGGDNCDTYNVPANTESKISLNPYGIGEYTISLTGFPGFTRQVIASSNFTVTSNTPSINWGATEYYLDETMFLNVYVPSGTKGVNITYPNGTNMYNNQFSSASTIQNISFQTNSNSSTNNYPPGTYYATIEDGNSATTVLRNISSGAYYVRAPSSVKWGTTFKIEYQAPRTATLYILDKNNNLVDQAEVTGTDYATLNSSKLTNEANNLTIRLIRNGNIMAETYVKVTSTGTQSGVSRTNTLLTNDWLYAALVLAAFFGAGLIYAKLEGGIIGSALGTVVNYGFGWIEAWVLFVYVLAMIIVFAMMSGKATTTGRD